MAHRPPEVMAKLREEWKQKLWQQEFFNLPVGEQAKVIGVDRATIYNWKNALTPEFWRKYERNFEENALPDMVALKMRMIKKGQSEGDVEAAKLAFQVAKYWSPKQTNENYNRNEELEGLDLQALKMEVLKEATREELLKALAAKGPPLDVVGGERNEAAFGS